MDKSRPSGPVTRRQALAGLGLLPAALATGEAVAASAASPVPARGFDGQRRGDLGDGRFLNPVFAIL